MTQTQNLFDTLRIAETKLKSRFPVGAEQEKSLIQRVAEMTIKDRLVGPKDMNFTVRNGALHMEHFMVETDYVLTIHRHALGQLCAKAGLPMNYVKELEKTSSAWRTELLAHNLNELFHQPRWTDRDGDARFLHRIVAGELRGFLSRRYNRHLASRPLLKAFSDVAKNLGAKPIEATATPVRLALKCMLPMVFEAFPGEYIAVGVEWSNSDFGAGKLLVCQTVWRVDTGTSAVLDETLGRVHLGSVIEDSDVEMSDETAKKEMEAQQSAIVDAVTALLSEKTVERMLKAIRTARDEKIPWTKLRGQLARFLNKSDVDWLQKTLDTGEGIIDLPPISFEPDGTRTPNAYWASVAIGHIAAKAENPDRRMELQREAGKLLAGLLGEA